MYDINTKNVRKGKKFYFIFLIVGVLFLVLMGFFIIRNYVKLNSLDSSTTAKSIDVKSHIDDEGTTMYSPVYYYQVDGKEYSCGSNSSSSSYPNTSNKTVYYDSENPSNCMTEYSKSSTNFIFIFLILPIVFIAVGWLNIHKINKRVKAIDRLNQNGRLVKNIPYHLENTGMSVNGVQVQRPVINYILPSGSSVTLHGDPRHDRKIADVDGLVDLVIDVNDPNNYFIDFEINRLSGNLPQDYYDQNGPTNTYQQTTQFNQMYQTLDQQGNSIYENNNQGL